MRALCPSRWLTQGAHRRTGPVPSGHLSGGECLSGDGWCSFRVLWRELSVDRSELREVVLTRNADCGEKIVQFFKLCYMLSFVSV